MYQEIGAILNDVILGAVIAVLGIYYGRRLRKQGDPRYKKLSLILIIVGVASALLLVLRFGLALLVHA